MRYSQKTISKRHHLGYQGGRDKEWTFALRHGAPVFALKHKERSEKISHGGMTTLREVMTDGRFESGKQSLMKKPAFFYGDSIPDSNEALDGKYKWIRVVGDKHLFLPDMDMMYPLIYLQPMSISRLMNWDLTKSQGGVMTGSLINRSARPQGSQVILGLQPGLARP